MPARRWLVLAALTLAQAAVSSAQVGLLTVGPSLTSTFGVSSGEAGLLGGAVTAGMLPTLLLWGALADRVGVRRPLLVGLLLTSCALAVAGRARTGHELGIALAVTGAFGASAVTGTSRAVFAWFGPRELALALGIRQSAIPVGGATAALLLPFTSGALGVRAAITALSVLVLISGAAVAAVLIAAGDPPARAPEPGS